MLCIIHQECLAKNLNILFCYKLIPLHLLTKETITALTLYLLFNGSRVFKTGSAFPPLHITSREITDDTRHATNSDLETSDIIMKGHSTWVASAINIPALFLVLLQFCFVYELKTNIGLFTREFHKQPSYVQGSINYHTYFGFHKT